MIKFFFKGLLLSGSLIVAIGGQNAFVLKQGLLKNHVFYICLICFLIDLTLMTIGVFGIGSFILHAPLLSIILSITGTIFLLYYGSSAFLNAYRGKSLLKISNQNSQQTTLKATIITTLAVSLLNPHVYLDTVVVIGGIANTFTTEQKLSFLIGAIVASFTWFFSLGYGSRLLTPLFKKSLTWRILDIFIGCIMWWIAIELILFLRKMI